MAQQLMFVYCGASSLHYASRDGHTEIVKLLLVNKANVHCKDVNGNTALINASEKGHIDIVEILLMYGADVQAENEWKETSLLVASRNGHSAVVKLLLKAGADVNYKAEARTALFETIVYGHLDTAKMLLEAGADIDITNDKGVTYLHAASLHNRTHILKLLLEWAKSGRGVDINSTNHMKQTPLIYASYIGSVDALRVLIDNKAEIDVPNRTNRTALIIAVTRGNWEIVQVLVEAGAYVLHRDITGENAINYLALGMCHETWADLLLKHLIMNRIISDAFCASDYGISVSSVALIGAFIYNRPVPQYFHSLVTQCVSDTALGKHPCLCGYLPRVFFTNHTGPTPLYFPHQGMEVKISLHSLATAVLCKLPVTVLKSLPKSSCCDRVNMLGQTPLHLLAMENHYVSDMNDKIRFLTKNLGISFSQKDHNGRTPYHIACMWGNAQFLLCGLQLDPDFGSNMNALDHIHRHPTFYMLKDQTNPIASVPSSQTLSSILLSKFLNERLNGILFEVHDTHSGKSYIQSIVEHYFTSICWPEPIQYSEPIMQITLSDTDIASLFADANKGVVDLENMLHRKQIVDVFELLHIVGTEMGKNDPLFECVPNIKGSVQENTKCGSLNELDMGMALANFNEYFSTALVPSREDNSIIASIQRKTPSYGKYWNDNATYFSSVKLCADCCQNFMQALGTKSVSQFLERNSIVIENYQRKYGCVVMLTLACKGKDGIQPMTVDVAPCIDDIYRYTPLLRPKKYETSQPEVEYITGLELSSYKKDWDFLKYVPMEVLCGYVLVKLLRSQTSTFQTEDGEVYQSEDILPSYMLKTTLLWILDPDNKMDLCTLTSIVYCPTSQFLHTVLTYVS